MTEDEKAIRELFDTWHRATAAGDLSKLLELMADDVIYLVPGHPPMRGKESFATGFESALQHFRIESSGEIQEIQVSDGWAWMWTELSVIMKPLNGGSEIRRAGNTLSVLKKQPNGKWVMVRDANMLTAEGDIRS